MADLGGTGKCHLIDIHMVRDGGFNGPVQLHFEYSGLGGAEHGKSKISISRDEFIRATRRDLNRIRQIMQSAGLA